MVNAGGLYNKVGVEMAKRSLYKAAKELGITRPTLEKWILQGKVKAKKIVVGERNYYEIDDIEIRRLKTHMVKDREDGKSWFKDD
jgi:hypothetical protein